MTIPRIGVTTRNYTSQKYDIPMIASSGVYCEALVMAGAPIWAGGAAAPGVTGG